MKFNPNLFTGECYVFKKVMRNFFVQKYFSMHKPIS